MNLWLPASLVQVDPVASEFQPPRFAPPTTGTYWRATVNTCRPFVGTLADSFAAVESLDGTPYDFTGTIMPAYAAARRMPPSLPHPRGALFRFDAWAVGKPPKMGFDSRWFRIAADCLPPPGKSGWASQTGWHTATTAAQRGVLTTVSGWQAFRRDNPFDGEASWPSTELPVNGKKTWLTDAYGPEGDGMIALIQGIDAWAKALTVLPAAAEAVPAEDIQRFKALTKNYKEGDQTLLVERALKCYLEDRAVVVPKAGEYEVAMRFLGVRAQCKETADRVVIGAGGTPLTHAENVALRAKVLSIDARPGMYAFGGKAGQFAHTMLVSDVQWSDSGQLTAIKVAESNFASGWDNPKGDIPWRRRIHTGRVIDTTTTPALSAIMISSVG